MRSSLLVSIICLALFSFATCVRAQTSLHVAISPWTDATARNNQQKELRDFILHVAPAGTSVTLWDGWSLQTTASATIPRLRYDNAAARAQNRELARFLTELKTWTASAMPNEAGLANSSALRIPEILDEIGHSAAAGPRAIILVGSPLYRSPAEPAFDMGVDARYPSDGHLALGLRDSVFGLAEKAGRLDRDSAHWAYANQTVWANELHRHSVTRFWTLFVQGQGGTLVTFGADLRAALTRAVQNGLPPVLRVQPDPGDEKPLMRSARPRSLPVWLDTPPAPPPVTTVSAPTPEPTPVVNAPVALPPAPEPVAVVVAAPPPAPPPPPPEVVTPLPTPVRVQTPANFDASKTGIGIAWFTPGVDLDLYVRLFADARELYYRRDRSPEGFLYKDERDANTGKFFEFVEFGGRAGTINLGQTSVWVNYYAGRGPVSGQVALFDRGTVRVGTFTLRAIKGNHGGDDRRRANSPYWTEIKLADLVEAAAPLAAHKPGVN